MSPENRHIIKQYNNLKKIKHTMPPDEYIRKIRDLQRQLKVVLRAEVTHQDKTNSVWKNLKKLF